jgi:hypothetical protein
VVKLCADGAWRQPSTGVLLHWHCGWLTRQGLVLTAGAPEILLDNAPSAN